MSTNPYAASRPGSFLAALQTQMRVIGALILRELHTRYGRDNIGYLWLIGEPLMLASVIAAFHASGHTPYGSDIKPLPFAVLGYTTYIIFRGVVNRSEGTLEGNAPLLYHRMVTIIDVVTSRALLEFAGVFLTYVVLMVLLISLGLCDPPARPLYLIAAQGLMLWTSWGQSLILTALTHDRPLLSRLTHPYAYLMIPISGAFTQLEWIPDKFRNFLEYLPLPHIFELARYGQFNSCNLNYFDGPYLIALCMVTTWVGLIAVRMARRHVHLS